jgi:hypothetical protein
MADPMVRNRLEIIVSFTDAGRGPANAGSSPSKLTKV